MISDYWLLSDLDGTLISTPHKAQGQYLPLTRSPCFEPLKRWLMNGGNVCIVTTADQRVIYQVYQPLRQCLAESEARCQEYLNRMERNASSPASSSTGGAEGRKRPMAGKLLLSLYTGAVLYLCTATSVYLLPSYTDAVHCATREAVALTQAYQVELPTAPLLVCGTGAQGTKEGGAARVACVKGTCMNRQTSDRLQARVKLLYSQYLRDILFGEPAVVEALRKMSARYKRMWRAVLTFLQNMFLLHKRQNWAVKLPPVGNDFTILFAGASQSEESKAWKLEFFSRCDGLLTALGILRVEYVEAEVFFGDSDGNARAGVDRAGVAVQKGKSANQRRSEAAERRRAAEEADQSLVREHAIASLLNGVAADRRAEVRPVVTNFATYMTNLLGTDSRDFKKRLDPSASPYDNVAQVIVLGVPLALFSRYFTKSVPDFIKAGVQAAPQPNSVVFSKTGVSKSTTLRYLLGKERVMGTPESTGGERDNPHVRGEAFAGCVEAARAIAFGDNPQSTDYELTVFDDVAFVSVEKHSQREERHQRIQRRLQRAQAIEAKGGTAKLPDGSPAPTHAELLAACRKSGPMMDDRLLGHAFYVGGEEDGAAVLLATLMDRLKVPPLQASAGYVGAEDRPVEVKEFQRTLAAAAGSAHRRAAASRFSKL